VVVATGSSPLIPPIDGLREADPWTNREATTAKEVPERLGILGGGVVGAEMSQAYTSLGTRVTLIEGEARLLAREEEFACEEVTAALADQGVDIRTRQKATRVARGAGGEVTVTLGDGAAVTAEQLLVAVGRTPQADRLGLETVDLDAEALTTVDARCRVPGRDWLYVIGDLNGRAAFTHMAKYQGRVCADHLLGKEVAEEHGADGPLSPRVIFTDPQVCVVGHTTRTAEDAGLTVRAVDVPTSGNAGGSFYGRNAPGTTRFVVDDGRGLLVGATIVGAETADFLHAATIAVVGEVPLTRLRHAVPSFPTRSEIWLRLFEELGM
jgi:pyruvate/2-oxoglutarate dehydrogenase complex dihydrolipoamide dehydrogenase (E3) component